jgi:hypothetical protein
MYVCKNTVDKKKKKMLIFKWILGVTTSVLYRSEAMIKLSSKRKYIELFTIKQYPNILKLLHKS